MEPAPTSLSKHCSDIALTTAPGSPRKSIGESLIQPARYHDSRSWTADIHVDRALIVARIELDWGACVVSDPDSD